MPEPEPDDEGLMRLGELHRCEAKVWELLFGRRRFRRCRQKKARSSPRYCHQHARFVAGEPFDNQHSSLTEAARKA